MLKKFNEWFRQLFQVQEAKYQDILDIKNHEVTIQDVDYFLAKAQFTDIPEMLGIERAVYGGKTPWDSSAFASELKRSQDRLYLVVRRHDRLLAFIGCTFNEVKSDAHITNIAVVPDFQSRGLGHYLIAIMVKKARELELKQVSLEVRRSNTRAQQLYQDMGFEQKGIKKGYYFGDHEDAVDMVLLTGAESTDA
ncbi:ribosomal protein S18-alanine N-acetyltransferase [Secundilactobacillus paracollinoides]|uniref:Ribosomal-protein-alanine N-acetyltransferase RimI n=1 Tax=Secundilactobacillus paracollinoides TaxID=240427 RepID=A0A1B2IZP7_9LACO|nr:ribosomal protein S18-alanine N-acetyltransferase [Secundilactobacillus paracollinoides]ANZ61558.1 ribosomal-protein-alanine N-acetyltransferase RimI [Secundilactobacillus paracollinoides]ANZ67478.1 ribosomal-protein-alanine N-acetyltransferase RimI [Secundilactobacillus paracollinoides]KRL76889.1 ribosomal-protein-alanine N-acetyltransferase [Secundilactobacillus paracollinoides DSM 15502 = JCM 11969]